MPTDGLTKALSTQKHATFLRQLNLMNLAEKLGEKPGKEAPKDDHNLTYGGTDSPEHKQE
jgi:hypothetical protein